ncbi:ectonucleoside triphosphate diphosphohydrolase 5-like isoform X1 [Xyrauchen texanus]|uniref:ectonucleoside triphosphate diphosphohydrolase 5-like isoform X1 n=1 Tax=Xyrauchen texanus TaxID=154827 RepID=UPI002242878F|nr:ectonucleoside triphosphate diphosphohydrolase 5-like isoform X1 [Xyrauchen texanus]
MPVPVWRWHLLSLWTLASVCFPQRNGPNTVDFSGTFGNTLPSLSRPANASQIFYGIMFDAGSTGTRIHVYTFIQREPGGLPVLDNEMFQSMKPGLSAYADVPEIAGHTVRQLLRVAQKTVPPVEWKRTPVVLRATAGLRLLPPAKAHALLEEVQDVFDESPFYVPADSVSIMNGVNEGVLAWVTVNFLAGHLYPNTQKTVGILDLGGGSTQITFLPKSKKTIESAPADYIARFDMFNSTYELYTHSYLGNGIKAARVSALGASASQGLERKVFKSSCLPKKYKGEFSFGGVTYDVSGSTQGTINVNTFLCVSVRACACEVVCVCVYICECVCASVCVRECVCVCLAKQPATSVWCRTGNVVGSAMRGGPIKTVPSPFCHGALQRPNGGSGRVRGAGNPSTLNLITTKPRKYIIKLVPEALGGTGVYDVSWPNSIRQSQETESSPSGLLQKQQKATTDGHVECSNTHSGGEAATPLSGAGPVPPGSLWCSGGPVDWLWLLPL